MPYLSALEMCSRRGAIQIHVYLYLYLCSGDEDIHFEAEAKALKAEARDCLEANADGKIWAFGLEALTSLYTRRYL